MLPGKKDFAAMLVGGAGEGEEEDVDGLDECADQLIEAVSAKDAQGVKEALRSAFQILDAEPHDEGEHLDE